MRVIGLDERLRAGSGGLQALVFGVCNTRRSPYAFGVDALAARAGRIGSNTSRSRRQPHRLSAALADAVDHRLCFLAWRHAGGANARDLALGEGDLMAVIDTPCDALADHEGGQVCRQSRGMSVIWHSSDESVSSSRCPKRAGSGPSGRTSTGSTPCGCSRMLRTLALRRPPRGRNRSKVR